MAIDLSKYRKNAASEMSRIIGAIESESNTSYNDERYWQMKIDKNKVGSAVIRFLPNGNENGVPFVRYYEHAFKGPTGKWYIERCLTSIGSNDPVAESNEYLWNTVGTEEAKKLVRARKRHLYYVSNVLVINDPANPDNNGKVFLFRYGKKIFEKIQDAIRPQFADDTPIDVFNPFDGAAFKLRSYDADGYVSYEKSTFDSPSPIGTEKEIEEIFGKLHDLDALVAPSTFKTYDELKKRFVAVVGNTGAIAPTETKSSAPSPALKPSPVEPDEPKYSESQSNLSEDGAEDDSDDVESFFARYK
jgi:hypothetical protein